MIKRSLKPPAHGTAIIIGHPVVSTDRKGWESPWTEPVAAPGQHPAQTQIVIAAGPRPQQPATLMNTPLTMDGGCTRLHGEDSALRATSSRPPTPRPCPGSDRISRSELWCDGLLLYAVFMAT